ncbi:MAG: phosphopantetheine-binding protein [bacterium]|nr:phosphopantetheine-binding protein [bacterium]
MQKYSREEITEQAKKMLTRTLGIIPEEITPDVDFFRDLGVNFDDFAGLITALEETFELELPLVAEGEEPAELCKFGTLVDSIWKAQTA